MKNRGPIIDAKSKDAKKVKAELAALATGLQQGPLPGPFHLGYPAPRGGFDEMVDKRGILRPHWEEFIELLGGLPPDEMAVRWERGQRLIRENGVTYNVYGDPAGHDRPWELDPMPLLISAEEWQGIEAALIQRATLLNHVLSDLYGPRHLVESGILPPAILYGHPGYLRACQGIEPAQGIHLHLYAVDLARSPDGRWWVTDDRTEAPSGAGYALENRSIISRVLPEFFRSTQVERLAPFFQNLQDTLWSLSPRRHDTPRIVLLTPGPYNETYFEHAYLARALGYTLVEAEDLTMREQRIFLKTLDGLQPVDVILRRTDGAFCDPLELRSESTLGIPGLLEAVREGNVTVANSLGSGLVENRALTAFLPALCRHLLGEQLRMPSVATWWCGQEKERDYVLEHLEELIIAPAFPRRSVATVFGDRLSTEQRSRLADRIRKRPWDYVGQEYVPLPTAPVWSHGRLAPRSSSLRVYVTAHEGSYSVMPGGLTRVAPPGERQIVTMQRGGGSKDAWVMPNPKTPIAPSVRTSAAPAKLARGARDLPSRVADNLYWMGRYLERADRSLRVLRTALTHADRSAGLDDPRDLAASLEILVRIGHTSAKAAGGDLTSRLRKVVAFELNPDKPGSLRANIDRLQRVAFIVRDRISVDTWRAVQKLKEEFEELKPEDEHDLGDMLSQVNRMILMLGALSGLAMENMTRGLGWRFYDLGRRLERGLLTLDLLSSTLSHQEGQISNEAPLDVLLEICDSIMTYRSRYLASPQFAPVLDLLLSDESNPRSLGFQLASLLDHMEALSQIAPEAPFYTDEQRLIIFATGAVRTVDISALSRVDEDGERRALAQMFEVLHSKLWELSEALTRRYFTHASIRRPMWGMEDSPRLP